MDWNDLRYLLAVHESGSLAKAATALGVTKSTVSRRLAALDEALGTRLTVRDTAGVTMTEAGLGAIPAAQAMQQAVLSLSEVMLEHEHVPGVVRVTAPPWLAERLLIPAVPTLRSSHPELDVRIVGSHELVDMSTGQMDIALRNVIPSSGPLVCRRVGELAGCVYGSELYLERRGAPRRRDDLESHDLLAYEGMAGMPGFEWIRDEHWATHIVFRAGDPVGLTSAIAAGLGLGAVPCILGETSPTLRRIESLGVGFSPLYVITHERNHAAPRIRAVIQFLEEVLRNNVGVLMGRGVDQDPLTG
jgi:DNA-binding transcriptional LysR family regulator